MPLWAFNRVPMSSFRVRKASVEDTKVGKTFGRADLPSRRNVSSISKQFTLSYLNEINVLYLEYKYL